METSESVPGIRGHNGGTAVGSRIIARDFHIAISESRGGHATSHCLSIPRLLTSRMQPRELTLRALILGALITTVFTAANVYLGLKVGLTFASSIPAAVISMAILSSVRNSSILENNIVQTVASAAGTLSAIIFVLPGLVIVGWWTGFPFWQSFLICVSGGILGVVFTIPLRRALVTHSDLPYPEGVAAAEVLKVGASARGERKSDPQEAREGLMAVILGSVASAGLAILGATQLAAIEIAGFFRLTASATQKERRPGSGRMAEIRDRVSGPEVRR